MFTDFYCYRHCIKSYNFFKVLSGTLYLKIDVRDLLNYVFYIIFVFMGAFHPVKRSQYNEFHCSVSL